MQVLNRCLFVLLIGSLFFVSCGKDEIIDGDEETIIIDGVPYDDSIVNFQGLVVRPDGMPLPGALVSTGVISTLTDDYGKFELSNVPAKQSSAYLSVDHPEYHTSYKFATSKSPGTGYVKIRMVEKILTKTISATEGGLVEMNGGASVSLPANGIVDELGNPYSGNVNVYAFWIDPVGNRLAEIMPGDLRAYDNNEYVQLGTFGMVSVDLVGANNETLNLGDGYTAPVVFPVPNDLQGIAPNTIPLWYFNEDSGYWEKEGEASLSGTNYVANVPHFSFWNCDAPFPVVEIELCINDERGNPIPNFEVRICAEDVQGVGYGWTDSNGCATGKIPKDKLLTIKYMDQCGNEVKLEEIGPFSENANIDIITLSSDSYLFVMEGQLLGCMGAPLNDAYLIVYTENDYFTIEIDENGNFSHPFSKCDDTEISVVAYDRENLFTSEEITLSDFSDPVLNLGMIEVCDEMIDEYIRFMVNGGIEVLVLNPDAWILNGEAITIGGIEDGTNFSANVKIPSISAGSFTPESFNFITDQQVTCINACDGSTIQLNEDPSVGDYITGSFTMFGEGPDGNISQVDGSYRIIVDGESDYGSISGQVFYDGNMDGLKNDGEFIEGQNVILNTDSGDIAQVTQSDANGLYAFEDLPPGNYFLQLDGDSLSLITSDLNVGMDPTIDNDFNGQLSTITYAITNAGENFENIDAGVNSEITCWAEGEGCGFNCFLYASASGGFGELSYEWDFGSTEQQPNCPGNGFEYTVTVSDAFGQECEATAFLEQFTGAIEGRVWQDVNDNNMFDSGVETEPVLSDLNVYLYYAWDTSNPINTTTTNQDGRYWFDIFDSDEFIVAVEAPEGMVPVEKDDNLYGNFTSKINLEILNTTPFEMYGTDEIENFDCQYYGQINAGFKPE